MGYHLTLIKRNFFFTKKFQCVKSIFSSIYQSNYLKRIIISCNYLLCNFHYINVPFIKFTIYYIISNHNWPTKYVSKYVLLVIACCFVSVCVLVCVCGGSGGFGINCPSVFLKILKLPQVRQG